MAKTIYTEFYELLGAFEDYVSGGICKERHAPPHPDGLSGAEAYSEPTDDLQHIAREIASCTKCALAKTRQNTVPGTGVEDPLVLVIGEGPGAEEDVQGLPFVGAAGQLLDKMLAAIGLDRRRNCYIANIVKCRPPGNRDPLPEETEACLPFLARQIACIRPRAILTVGRMSSQLLIGQNSGIGELRGTVYAYRGIPLVPTYHPSAVLRNPDLKRPVWEDLKRLKALLGNE